MAVFQKVLEARSRGKGTYEVTGQVAQVLRDSGLANGLVNIHCLHTSCSLVLMENADPSARQDLEAFMERLVPENLPYFVHTYEGADDMPSHIKMALTRSNESIPFSGGQLVLGTWQGVFLWEHRAAAHTRKLVVTVYGE